MSYKRTKRESDGKLTIIYQDNGWVCYHKEYDNGDTETWYEKG